MSKKLTLSKQISTIFEVYSRRPKGAKGVAAIKRDRKLALRRVGIK